MIKQYIKDKLLVALSSQLPETISLFLENPKHENHGDYALTVAFQLAPLLKKSPIQIAVDLSSHLSSQEQLNTMFEFFPINGFINIRLKDAFFEDLLLNPMVYKPRETEKVCLEFVSANPTGPLHIGHGRWAVLGSVLSNILSFVGYKVENEFYINDAGNQIDLFYKSVEAIKQGVDIPENGYHGDYIRSLAHQQEDPLLLQLEQQKGVLKTLGVSFDTWFSEKELHKSGAVEDALSSLKTVGWTYEKDGALWFRSSDLGDSKDRVLVKADGKLTYFAVDIAYHFNKLGRHFDRLINIWGADHHGYVSRVKAAVKALKSDIDLDTSFIIIIGQLVNLLRDGEPVRMSKRTGDMISLEEVIDDIGVDATRYFLVSKSSDTHIEFDLELAKKKSAENPVYYIQYAHARICTLLLKVGNIDSNNTTLDAFLPEERILLCKLIQFYDEVELAAVQYAPYKLAQYAYDLSKLFHSFYEACPVASASDSEKYKRYLIVNFVQSTLVQCLTLLGISAPDSM